MAGVFQEWRTIGLNLFFENDTVLDSKDPSVCDCGCSFTSCTQTGKGLFPGKEGNGQGWYIKNVKLPLASLSEMINLKSQRRGMGLVQLVISIEYQQGVQIQQTSDGSIYLWFIIKNLQASQEEPNQ